MTADIRSAKMRAMQSRADEVDESEGVVDESAPKRVGRKPRHATLIGRVLAMREKEGLGEPSPELVAQVVRRYFAEDQKMLEAEGKMREALRKRHVHASEYLRLTGSTAHLHVEGDRGRMEYRLSACEGGKFLCFVPVERPSVRL